VKAHRKRPAFTRTYGESSQEFAAAVGRALRRAAKTACRIARMYGTPIYIEKSGKIVALKP